MKILNLQYKNLHLLKCHYLVINLHSQIEQEKYRSFLASFITKKFGTDLRMKKYMLVVRFIKRIVNKIKMEIRYRKRLKELRKRDPFIYK